MSFEVFDRAKWGRSGRYVRVDSYPTLTLSRGVMAINQAAYEALGSPERVHLMFDRERSAIGLKASGEEGFRLSVRSRGRARTISAINFYRHYSIEPDGKRRPAHMEGEILACLLRGEADGK